MLAVKGKPRSRAAELVNPKIPTGEIEVLVDELRVLNVSAPPPFAIEDGIDVAEDFRLQHRYIDLRRPEMQQMMKMRHDVTMAIREHMSGEGFVEVETPILFKSTPEGARDFLVPSRVYPGKVYALPQSPQLLKQLLMIAGTEKYFQIARCFRDEDPRADRSVEFTQLDMEMSYVGEEQIFAVVEGMLKAVFKKAVGVEIETPFPRMSYEDALAGYGSDKPDLRFEMKMHDLSETFKDCEFKVFKDVLAKDGGAVLGLAATGCAGYSRSQIDELINFVIKAGGGGLAWVKYTDKGFESSVVKFMGEERLAKVAEASGAKVGDLLLFVADQQDTARKLLGALRLELGKKQGLRDKDKQAFLWVLDFPLFLPGDKPGELASAHHPFTAPHDEDLGLLDKHPLQVKSRAYDLVINGVEISSGSIRIHQREIQEKIFELLGYTREQYEERFGFLLEALGMGAPPHGGFAPGIDRLCMILRKTENIRDVNAFAKTGSGQDLMTGAPSEVPDAQWQELGLQLREKE